MIEAFAKGDSCKSKIHGTPLDILADLMKINISVVDALARNDVNDPSFFYFIISESLKDLASGKCDPVFSSTSIDLKNFKKEENK